MKGFKYTEEQRMFIEEHINDMTNKQIAEAIGTTKGGVCGYCFRNNLKRSKERRAHLNSERVRGRKQVNPNSLANLRPNPQNFFKMTDEEKAQRNEKAVAARKKLNEDEKRRLLFGLPQKTRIRFCTKQELQRHECYRRLKRLGYKYLGCSRFLVPVERHKRIEKSSSERFEIKFLENEGV